MWNRLRDSIVTPRNVVDYRNDAFWKVSLYILLFTVLLSTTAIIQVINFNGINRVIQDDITSNITSEIIDCDITEGVLTCDENKNYVLVEHEVFNVYIEGRDEVVSQDYTGMYNFVIKGDSVYGYMNGISVGSLPLSEFPDEIKNLDFTLKDTDQEAFEEQVFTGLNNYLMEYKVYWGSLSILFELIGNLILITIFILLSTWFLRLRFKMIPFRHLFVITTYSSTLLYIILILNSLYSFSLFTVLILIVIAVRQNSQVSMEILRRLTKKT